MLRLEPGNVMLTPLAIFATGMIWAFDQPKAHKSMHLVAVTPHVLVEFLQLSDIWISLVFHHPRLAL